MLFSSCYRDNLDKILRLAGAGGINDRKIAFNFSLALFLSRGN